MGGHRAHRLLKTSGSGAYAPQAERGSSPSVITDVIVKAARARRPKTRYAAGFMARPALFLRRILPDRAFDAMFLFGPRRFA